MATEVEPRTWLNDERQELLRWLMASCYWSGEGVAQAWEELARDLEQLDKHVWRLMDDAERKQFYAARRVWPMRNEITPSGGVDGDLTWGQWFESMFGESLDAYAARAVKLNLRQKVMEYEIATFGHSPLRKDAAA